MNMKKLLLTFIAIAACSAATAAPPSDKSLNRWMEVQHIERDFLKNLTNMTEAQNRQLMQPIISSYPPELQPQLQAASDRYANKVFTAYLTPQRRDKLMKEIKKVAKDEFTQQEIDAMIAFYETPVGQSIMEKNSSFLKKLANIEPSEADMKEIETISERYLIEFEKEVEKIMPEECTP
jgi:putative periplasmic protein